METFQSLFLDNNISNGIIFKICNYETARKEGSISWNDILYLTILGGICTSFAFVVSVEVMKFLSPYNVIMAVNLEPVYSILLALVLFGESESMNFSFYLGAFLIICAVSLDGYLKKQEDKKSIK